MAHALLSADLMTSPTTGRCAGRIFADPALFRVAYAVAPVENPAVVIAR
jgi:hypothetical protein